jgi:3-dehydroquinate synthase
MKRTSREKNFYEQREKSVASDQIDVEFVVPQTHRLRFTTDVFGEDRDVLAAVLESSDGQAVRVQFWVDQHVADATPDLLDKINRFIDCNADRITRVGSVQFVPGGEDVKNDVHVIERMLKVFNAGELDRRSYVIAIGGGAVLDAVGFATAIAHRGLRLVRLPTTTLAQGDSGVGVKNGTNLFQKKNWMGAFAVPWAVINDAELLTTLSNRDFISGFSEAVKVSLLKDSAQFEEICQNAVQIRARNMEVALPVIKESAKMHLDHITQGGDPYEALEARPLDYGHWSAHKMEVMSGFALRHGEAVAIGVAIDTVYSSLVHGLDSSVPEKVLKCLTDLGFTLTDGSLTDVETLFCGLEEFRQHLGGRLTLTMLRNIGDAIDVHQVQRDKMVEAIEYVMRYANVQSHLT